MKHLIIPIITLFCFYTEPVLAQNKPFKWPEGKRMAISLSFDDARLSNVDEGTALLNEYDVKATFYLVPNNAKQRLEGWKKAVASGHEIGNHSINHACSGNFVWARKNPLEDYTLEKMREELIETNRQLKDMLGVTPTVYAYPCGQTSLGRGKNTQSFVPLISELFVSGRTWLDEAPVDPTYCDMAQLTGMETDGKSFEQILTTIKDAAKNGQWLVLAGHETAASGAQTTRLDMLRQLCAYAKDPANSIWIAPVGEVAAYVKAARDTINIPEMVGTQTDGKIVLNANTGKGLGPKIQYMPEWKAFGWFTAADRVEWDVDITNAGKYEIQMEWSVDDTEAGKPFVIEAGGAKYAGKVGKTGSWETFKKETLGQLKLAAGKQKLVFKPGSQFSKGALLDLRAIELVPVK
ncbi:polysaccharide deacetylase family protein [Dyadobacter chenhuakuii]|uniref:Polysaccharide deacetylase family protein n=1 Tax=Dyadobacter chenhuakuii TaxID=2909339 RepID=A0A9X1TSF6_9BACT|nr:polysaccharide deacetylase family protein [Dyadobacter chenhuakuii]MCF2497228.1 polysaccharide deacetylase family protein [Dyadobacter chenhuakuii]